MRFIMLLVLLTFTAQASFFAEYCSSAKQSFSMQTGHLPSVASIAYMDFSTNKKIVKNIDMNTIVIKDVSTSTLKETSIKNCNEGKGGMISWTNTKLAEKVISFKNGDLFPESMSGLSADRKELRVTMLCEIEGNSRASCN